MTVDARIDRNAFREYPLDGALLHFHPATGTHIRFENDATRALKRRAPRVVMFGITNKCNLTCDFCSRDARRASAWTVSSAAAVLRDLSAAGTLEVAFGGGEPFTFPGFAELVAELYATTPLVLNVTTNGTLIREQGFGAFAGRFGQVRVSIYDDPRWRDGCAVLKHYGQRWGANLIVDDTALDSLRVLLAELATLGCHDVSLLSYVGPDPRKHLAMSNRARLAGIIEDAPIACRLSVCFGNRIPVPLLFDGADGQGDCGAGRDFVSITPDRRMQGCSFHDGGLPASTAQEILHGWQTERTRLEAPSPRDGCARRSGVSRGTQPLPPIAIWQAFSGNNSGECVMVAKFETTKAASAYLAQLLPSWVPEASFPTEWQNLLVDKGVATAPKVEWRETPRELLAIGRSVIAIGYAAEDMFAELRALAWKQGAWLIPGGIHVHDGLSLLAAIRGSNEHDAKALAATPLHPAATSYQHGDVVLITFAMMDKAHPLESAGEAHGLLTTLAGNRPLAAEILFDPVDTATMIAVKKRLGTVIPGTPRLAVRFWGKDAEEKVAKFASLVSEGSVTVVGTYAIVSGVSRRKRLAVLAYRLGADVTALDGTEITVHAHLSVARGNRSAPGPASIETEAASDALKAHLSRGSSFTITSESYGKAVDIRTSLPENDLAAFAKVAESLGASPYTSLAETDPLAFAVRRVIAEVKSER